MIKKLLLSLCIFIVTGRCFVLAQCPIGNDNIVVSILTDNYPFETSWTIKDGNGTVLLQGGNYTNGMTVYLDSICVPINQCLTFDILDAAGDGICCNYGMGAYSIFENGIISASGGQFSSEEKHFINCPPGSNCETPFTAIKDSVLSSAGQSTWYSFTPDSTGIYSISTCFPENHCDTKIWVYDHCTGLVFDSLQAGTIYYNDDACGQQSFLSGGLQAGITYWIRIGGDAGCIDSTISWQLTYNGPIVGCTDPSACNYNPLATIDNGTCLFPGDPLCTHGPDLAIDQNDLTSSIQVGTINGNDACLVGEGCLSGYGLRQVINFTTTIRNIGDQDYYIGPPQAGNTQFVFDQCHNHWHYAGYADYQLYDMYQHPLQLGFKNGFCVLDLMCFTGSAKYGCSDMGITAGCADSYSSGLPCQWIDVTDVPAGQYTLVVQVNWDHSPDKLGHVELRYDNNVGYVCLNISRGLNNIVSVSVIPTCSPIIDCLGDTFGLAKTDCLGNCNGTRLSGDLDVDSDRDSLDFNNYMNDIVNGLTPAPCNDLNGDNILTVTDAARLNACVRDSLGTHTHPAGTQNTHPHCLFPYNIININDTVKIGFGIFNTASKYLELNVLNKNCRLLGLDFTINGMIIDSVVSIFPGFSPVITWNSNGHIAMFAANEINLDKQLTAMPVLRIYYHQLTSQYICFTNLEAPVNANYEETMKSIFNGCVVTTGISHVYNNSMLSLTPNPSMGIFTLKTNTLNGEVADVEVFDALGNIVMSQREILNDQNGIVIDMTGKQEGVYLLQVKTKNITATQKLMLMK